MARRVRIRLARPAWFARHPRWNVYFTPTSASWLNQIDASLPCSPKGSCGVHRSPRELEHAILGYIDTVNASPRLFRWTKSADDILATIKRSCLHTLDTVKKQTKISRTSESGH